MPLTLLSKNKWRSRKWSIYINVRLAVSWTYETYVCGCIIWSHIFTLIVFHLFNLFFCHESLAKGIRLYASVHLLKCVCQVVNISLQLKRTSPVFGNGQLLSLTWLGAWLQSWICHPLVTQCFQVSIFWVLLHKLWWGVYLRFKLQEN